MMDESYFVPRAQHIQRTFQITSSRKTLGTAFVIDHDSHEYIVTALHNIPEVLDIFQISLRFDRVWKDFVVDIVGCDESKDPIILRVHEKLLSSAVIGFPISPNVYQGQTVFFLGYPYNILGHSLFNGSPMPFARRGILSNIAVDPPSLMYIAATANLGFSGAPVFAPSFHEEDVGTIRLVGMILESLAVETEVKDADGQIIGKTHAETDFCRALNALQIMEMLP